MSNSGYNGNYDNNREAPRVPWWMYVAIILCMLPGLGFPWMVSLSQSPEPVVRGLLWFYPAYVLVSGLLAWQCYGRRTTMTWIILILLLMSHACFYYMTFVPMGNSNAL